MSVFYFETFPPLCSHYNFLIAGFYNLHWIWWFYFFSKYFSVIFTFCLYICKTFLVAQTVKHLPTMQETLFPSLGQEDLLEKKWQPTPVFLPGKSPWTEEPGRLQSMGRTESDTTEHLHFLSLYICKLFNFICFFFFKMQSEKHIVD